MACQNGHGLDIGIEAVMDGGAGRTRFSASTVFACVWSRIVVQAVHGVMRRAVESLVGLVRMMIEMAWHYSRRLEPLPKADTKQDMGLPDPFTPCLHQP